MSNYIRSFKVRKAFLDSLEVGNSLNLSAQAAGPPLSFFKRWREQDEDFAKDWDDAIECGTDFIEDVATQRALTKSDALMAMILRARRPDKFDRGSKLELSGNVNVEGSKAKLLNRIARLQALTAQAVEEASPEGGEEEAEGATEIKALPAPASGIRRGRSNRGKAGGSGRKKSTA